MDSNRKDSDGKKNLIMKEVQVKEINKIKLETGFAFQFLLQHKHDRKMRSPSEMEYHDLLRRCFTI